MSQTRSAGAVIEEGIAHHRANRLDKAEACYRRVLDADPEHAAANHLLGLVAKHRGNVQAAIQLIEKALARAPDMGEAHYNLGNTRWQAGDLDGAIACYDRALAVNPDHEDAWVNKGRSVQQSGDREEAARCFREALRINPDSGKAWENLSFTRSFAADDPEVEDMRAALDRADPRGENAKCLHYALGKARADAGMLDAAVAHYAFGNAITRAGIKYGVQTDERFMANVARAFPRERVQKLDGGGDPDARPIFVLGMPRSGTTLIEQILASHPRVDAGGERKDMDRVIDGVTVQEDRERRFPDWVPDLDAGALAQLGRAYLNRLPDASQDADRLTDKLPGNFRLLGLIRLALPNAAIIHVHREPADTCLSCYLHNFTRRHQYSLDQIELGRYYRAYHQLMQHWREVLPDGAFIDVRYEDVVADPEGQTQRILSHCGLTWDDRCLRFHETERPVQTASMDQVRQPLYSKSIGRWRRYAPYLGPLFTALDDLAPADAAARAAG